MPRLIVLTGPDAGKEFPILEGDSSLGRAEANAIVLTDPQVSRRQFDLHVEGKRVDITDRGSGNGTLVNGVRITTATLELGDRIQIGDSTLLYQLKGMLPPGVVRTLPEDAGSVLLAKPDAAGSDWLRTRLAHLGVIYEASNAVNEILDVDVLLARLLDLTVTSTDADIGFVLLAHEETGEWLLRCSQSKRSGIEATAYSRTIADYVRHKRLGVLATDATLDDRFAGGESIVKQGIREVIAVPMKGRRGTVGAIVVETIAPAVRDSSKPTTRFTSDHLTLASALAHQAALAVEETRYYRAMVNAEKLAAVGTAVSHLSHHIKNIMHGVRFGGDLLNRGLAGDDRELVVKGWQMVERNQARIDDLIQDMLGYSKDREPLKEPTDLNALVADAIETIRGRAGDIGIELTLTPCADGRVNADAEGIYRAVLNVISNAVDAVRDEEAGRVDVTIRSPEAGILEILVADNGPGIPDEMREDIFKPFVSTKGSRGTGLGLPVSRKILREHGGDLTAEAGPGGRFLFRLAANERT
ncbi:MAG: FHA domain-containing protein [Gemmataceae bacterium]